MARVKISGRIAAVLILACVALRGAADPLRWDWQLDPPYDFAAPVDALDTDPDNVTAAEIAALNARGIMTICYVSIGTLEDWRSDIADFPPAIIGNRYDDWPDERFLDIRALDVLIPLMRARLTRCRALGFQAVEPDNLDVYANESGFALTPQDGLAYALALTALAHDLGLQIGQKNAPDLAQDLAGTMDFAITENCLQDGWCAAMRPYTAQGKPVFAAEYGVPAPRRAELCQRARVAGLSLIFKRRTLDRWQRGCM